MNWGHKILITIVAFILIMLSMVYVAMKQTNEMEDANYYEKEMKYQARIDAAHNLNEAGNDTILTLSKEGVSILIPEKLRTDFENGKIEFLRSNDQKKDLTINFTTDSSGQFFVERSKFTTGFYKAKIDWDNEQKHFYKEQVIYIE